MMHEPKTLTEECAARHVDLSCYSVYGWARVMCTTLLCHTRPTCIIYLFMYHRIIILYLYGNKSTIPSERDSLSNVRCAGVLLDLEFKINNKLIYPVLDLGEKNSAGLDESARQTRKICLRVIDFPPATIAPK